MTLRTAPNLNLVVVEIERHQLEDQIMRDVLHAYPSHSVAVQMEQLLLMVNWVRVAVLTLNMVAVQTTLTQHGDLTSRTVIASTHHLAVVLTMLLPLVVMTRRDVVANQLPSVAVLIS